MASHRIQAVDTLKKSLETEIKVYLKNLAP